jgi:hypothetical protein
MRSVVAAALFAVVCFGCSLPNVLAGGDAGSSTDPLDGGAAEGSGPVQGAECTVVGQNASICLAISTCPTTQLDPRLFPSCGYRIHGDALDLECVCDNTWLCPIGVPSSCDQIPGLVAQQTQDTVCAQVNEGRCTQLIQ